MEIIKNIMREGDKLKKAFKTKYGLYKCLIMLFGLINIPSTFMELMNHTLHAFYWQIYPLLIFLFIVKI